MNDSFDARKMIASEVEQKKRSSTSHNGMALKVYAILTFCMLIGGAVFFAVDEKDKSTTPTNAPTTPTNAPTTEECDPASVNLSKYKQWQEEEGYWLGEYSLYGSNGDPSVSASWNYKYDHYRGFITGNVKGNKYRQRNVFMYPPQDNATCLRNNETVGSGTCGTNGNMKIFEADQSATTCSRNPLLGGAIEGPYGSMQYTYTTLVGQDNALLYQVYMPKAVLNQYEMFVLGNPLNRCAIKNGKPDCGYTEDRLMQSQLTTLTKLPSGQILRTRTAQGFEPFTNAGSPTYASYYRERKVSAEEFWRVFNETKKQYNILETDECKWKSGETGGTERACVGLSGVNASCYLPGFAACKAHLEESFEL